jgi:hypothetical protein
MDPSKGTTIEIVPTPNFEDRPGGMLLEIVPTSNGENHQRKLMLCRAVAFTLALTMVVGAVAVTSSTKPSTEVTVSSADWIVLDIGNDRCMDGWLYSVATTGNDECRQKCEEDARCIIYNIWKDGWCQGHSACGSTSPDDENPSIPIKTYRLRHSYLGIPLLEFTGAKALEQPKDERLVDAAAENTCDAYMARADDG